MSEEIELLDRVLLRLGAAESDEQLEVAVNKFLGPVLLKIDSPEESVRKRVMEILTHINKRLKSRPLVKVPLEVILKLYQESSSSFLNNFAIIYIILGFPRVDHDKQVELTPTLLSCLERKPEPHQDKILLLILPLLGALKIPGERIQETLGLKDKPNTKKQLLSLLQDILLLPYGITPDSDMPLGFSPYSFKRALADGIKAEDLEALKKGIVKFITSGAFSDEEVLSLLVVATADTRFSVATPALQEVNKISPSLDWSKASLSAPLYTLFTGNGSKVPDRKTTPVNTRVRQKIFQHLLKCRGAGVNTAKGIQIIFESLFGEGTNQKCKVLALQFADVLITNSDRELMKKLAVVVLTGLSKLITPESTEPSDVKNAAYNALARLITVCPATVNTDVKIVVNYFNYLSVAPSELHTSIREALVALAQAFAWKPKDAPAGPSTCSFVPDSNQNLLIGLLAEKAESKSTIIQNVASIFLTTCFPDFYVPARYLLLMIAGTSPSLKEMVTVYLYGNSKKDNVNYSFISSVDSQSVAERDEKSVNLVTSEQRFILLPSFKDMVEYVYEQAEKKASAKTDSNAGKLHLAFSYDIYTEILDYLRLCLWFSAGVAEMTDEKSRSAKLGIYIRKLAEDPRNFECIKHYNGLIKCMVMSRKGFTELSCLFDLVSATPEIITEHNLDLLESLDKSLKEISENNRSLIAKSYGIFLAYGVDEAEFTQKVRGFMALASKSLEHQHGSVLALNHALHCKVMRFRKENRVRYEALSDWSVFVEAVNLLVLLMTSTYHLLMRASIEGIGLIGSVTALPLVEESPETMEVDGESVEYSRKYVLELLFKHLKSAHSRGQISEESAVCLGHLTIGDPKFFTKRVLKGFVDLIKLTKNPSIHIAIAQALVLTVQKTEEEHSSGCSDEDFDWLLDEIIRLVPEPYPNSRQASAIWLLALVKNCSDRQPILRRRQVLQAAFTELLSEDSELVQDVSSRGLGIVYSLCDADTQERLSSMLLEQLTGGRRQALKVNEESKVFEEGVLGKAPTGGNLSTYKELCALASDLNQPEMIYQFMQLANHNAAWQSKLGAAFGIKSISKTAKVKMQPYLGKIVPRLFRYKYDPTPKIQNSMISIWDSVVVDSKATIELYYWEILDDVTTNLTSKEWRTRIACALAVRDLIKRPQGLKLRSDAKTSTEDETAMETNQSVPEPELELLWRQLFRVMDDIHEGTRLAAEGTVGVLSKVCIVAASSSYGKAGLNVASSILPFLLEEGITHTVPEIRKLSIKTVSELVDSSQDLIKSHLPILVPCLLKATGELDSVRLSHYSNMVSTHQGAQEVVDSFRAEQAKSHHTMDALAKCIRFLDYPNLEKMTPAVLEVMKTSVNLGTKIACAHFICLMTIQIGKECSPIAGKYLTACLNGLSDRNTTVKKYYSSAIGHLVGCAKEQSLVRLFTKLTEFYFDPESTKARAIPATIQAINKRYPDVLKDYAANIIPLIFFAMHEDTSTDEGKQTVEQWRDVWNEINVGDVGLKLNLESIVARLEKCFESQSWLLKSQSAKAIDSIATRMDSNLGDADRRKLVGLLLANIVGRTYAGKENTLKALASLSKHLERDESDLHVKLIDAVMRECRKEEPVYKTHALKAIGEILDRLQEDRFEELYNMISFLLDKTDLAFGEDDDVKSLSHEEKSKSILVLINLKEAVCEALGKAWPLNAVDTQQKYQLSFARKTVECLRSNTRQVQVSLMVALGKFLEKLYVLNAEGLATDPQEKRQKIDESETEKIIETVLTAVVDASEIPHSGLKKEALNIVLTLIKKVEPFKSKNHLSVVRTTFSKVLPNFQKESSPEIKCRLREIEEKLK